MFKNILIAASGAMLALAGFLIPSQSASADVNVYTTPGEHTSSGRQWRTWCEDYSSTIQRCWTEIVSMGKWTFNNLTYLPAPRALWTNNPLAQNGARWNSDGRQWRTSCNDEWTGPNACRSFILVDGKWVFNNIVAFGTPKRVDTSWRPGSGGTGPGGSTGSQNPAPAGPAPSYSGFPDASNTGVPAGVTLRQSSGIVVTTPGTVIDALDVRGSIVVRADNVTIKNSRVTTDARYPIHITSGVTGTLIDHVEVSNAGSNGKGIFFDGGTGTVRYSDIHSAEDGVHIVADGVTLEHNYIHDLTRFAGAHPDTIQIRGGDNITVRHNNLQAYTASIGVMNAAIQIGSLAGGDTITNLRVTDNLMNGGHVTVNGGGRGEVDSAIYSNNRFGRAHQYSVQANVQNSVWEASNVYDDNGQPAR
ncbi:right-handed parallel beta-helix repeat-containing protein [Tessaracoccus rhinocerotis]|uniref:Right-handed parallel beta-helix repeat-containing protein n=1 Tax=Tessaracoccus rhinocerotis TaxID=1689449 RepID=A0A553K1Q8_9ACTN|nr:right-handed parallel beta-helix repeat-containing protein [Tessaracoccus rhinocerotis]